MIATETIATETTDTTDGGRRTEISALQSENQSGWMSQLKRKPMATPKLT